VNHQEEGKGEKKKGRCIPSRKITGPRGRFTTKRKGGKKKKREGSCHLESGREKKKKKCATPSQRMNGNPPSTAAEKVRGGGEGGKKSGLPPTEREGKKKRDVPSLSDTVLDQDESSWKGKRPGSGYRLQKGEKGVVPPNKLPAARRIGRGGREKKSNLCARTKCREERTGPFMSFITRSPTETTLIAKKEKRKASSGGPREEKEKIRGARLVNFFRKGEEIRLVQAV